MNSGGYTYESGSTCHDWDFWGNCIAEETIYTTVYGNYSATYTILGKFPPQYDQLQSWEYGTGVVNATEEEDKALVF